MVWYFGDEAVLVAENGGTPLSRKKNLQQRGSRNMMMQSLHVYMKLAFPFVCSADVEDLLRRLNCQIILMHCFEKISWKKRWR